MSTPGGGAEGAGGAGGADDAARAAQERLTEEARATASALIDWLGTRVDAPRSGPGATSGSRRTTAGHSRLGMRPPQSPGPCAWCPICALVAALRGEQPELTARLAEQASGLMTLLRLMVQTHQDPGHGHHHAPGAGAPAGWPAEWGAWDGWGAGAPTGTPAGTDSPDEAPRPADAADAPRPDDTADTAHPAAAGAEDGAAPARPTSPPRRTAANGPAGPRRVPIRRASPRSAAFRDTPPAAAPTAPAPTAHAPTEPAPTPTPAPPPATAAPDPGSASSAHPAPGPARPAVQRIAIRRPERPARSTGKARPDGAGGGTAG